MTRVFVVLLIVVSACGGGQETVRSIQHVENKKQARLDIESTAQRSRLVRVSLTTEVDEKRYRPLLPPSNDFSAEEPIIYLTGRLEQVQADSAIEVKWFINASGQPLQVSSIQCSHGYQFLASFEPLENKFARGNYTARVYVDKQEIGAVPFLIYDDTYESRGLKVRNIKFSTRIKEREQPINPVNHFPKGTSSIFVTFDLKGTDIDKAISVRWYRGVNLFHTEDVISSGEKRYAVYVVSFPNLPAGDYRVEFGAGANILGAKGFLIGKTTTGPIVDEIKLGKKIGKRNFPARSTKRFRRTDQIIHCGLNFLDLEPKSRVEIEWAQIAAREQVVLSTEKMVIESGGSGALGTKWEPEGPLKSGKYKVTVLINGEHGGEKEFEVR